jgi:hypothetical protein
MRLTHGAVEHLHLSSYAPPVRLIAVVTAVATAAIAACSDGQRQPLALYAGEWNGDDARLEGTFEKQGDCLLLMDEERKEWLLAFAEDGASWDESRSTARFGTNSLRVGDHVAVGGSSLPGYTPKWVKPPAKGCATNPVWFVGL